MIPNSAPMAVVFKGVNEKLFSCPVIAWTDSGNAMIALSGVKLHPARDTATAKLLGLWQSGWSPTYAEMASLLPEYVPGTPHPQAVHVTVRETPEGWVAFRTDNNRFVTDSTSYEQLEKRLVVMLGTAHIDAIVPMDRDT